MSVDHNTEEPDVILVSMEHDDSESSGKKMSPLLLLLMIAGAAIALLITGVFIGFFIAVSALAPESPPVATGPIEDPIIYEPLEMPPVLEQWTKPIIIPVRGMGPLDTEAILFNSTMTQTLELIYRAYKYHMASMPEPDLKTGVTLDDLIHESSGTLYVTIAHQGSVINVTLNDQDIQAYTFYMDRFHPSSTEDDLLVERQHPKSNAHVRLMGNGEIKIDPIIRYKDEGEPAMFGPTTPATQ